MPVSVIPMFAASPRNSKTSISQSFMILLQDLPELPAAVSFMMTELSGETSQDLKTNPAVEGPKLRQQAPLFWCPVWRGVVCTRLARGRLYTSTFFHPFRYNRSDVIKGSEVAMSLFCGRCNTW